MGPNDNRRPGVVSRSAGDYDSSSSANVIRLPIKLKTDRNSPFESLTARLVLDQHRRGVLPAAVVEYLLAGAGLRP
jgi:hypothetical protein